MDGEGTADPRQERCGSEYSKKDRRARNLLFQLELWLQYLSAHPKLGEREELMAFVQSDTGRLTAYQVMNNNNDNNI